MKKETLVYLDEEEKEIMQAYERGDYVLAPHQEQLKQELQQAARNTLQKNARTNIRLSPSDLSGFKHRAVEEGMPYQTLMASVLHKYITGKLVDVSTVQQLVNAGLTAPSVMPLNPEH